MRLKGSVECVPKRAMLCLCCIYSHEQGAQIVIKNLPGPREAWPLKTFNGHILQLTRLFVSNKSVSTRHVYDCIINFYLFWVFVFVGL